MTILRSFLSAVLLVTATVAIPVPNIDKVSASRRPPIRDEIFTRVKPIFPELSNTHADPILAESLARVEPSDDDVSSHAEPVPEEIDYRLPKNVIPINYTIELEPHIVEGNFKGETTIDIAVKEEVTNITFHAVNLEFSDTSLVIADGKKTIKPTNRVPNEVQQFLTLEFQEPIVPGNYKLKLKYVGTLQDNGNGFLRTSYVDENNATVFLAATHFDPIYARQAFPCFDEPALKAHFKISIKHFNNYTALSNMPAIESTEDTDTDDKIWTHFEVTPLMSTYLVAFTISDYQKLTNKDGTFNIWAKRHGIKNGQYALENGQKQLKLLEEYMGSKHVIPKMDNFALPTMKVATENWGLVAFPEQYLLYDETTDSPLAKRSIVQTMAHEYAHQWFGNLVTPSWWEHKWLKEGFAFYFQNVIPDKIEPSWRMMEQFVVTNIQNIAFAADDDEFQRAMSFPVESPEEITSNSGNDIIYTKAACVIRMFAHITGEKTFQKGLHQFLEKKKYSTASPDDLFDSILSAVENSSLKKEMKQSFQSWVTQAGYPVVSTKHEKLDRLQITSKRYLSKKPITHSPPEKWLIPINIATEKKPSFSKTNPDKWHRSGDTTHHSVDLSNWYIINKQQTGYYRVNYDLSNWKLLAKYLRTKDYSKIHVLNRAQLLDDSFNLVKSGDLEDFEVFFDISTYLEQEDDMVPWVSAFRAITILDNFLRNTDQYNFFKQYIHKLIAKLEKTINYSELSENTSFESTIQSTIAFACMVGSKNCQDATHKHLVAYINGEKTMPNVYQSVVLCGGIRSANATIWNKAFELFEKNNDTFVLRALGCSSDSEILKAYLEKAIVPESNISKYAVSVLYAISEGSAAGIDIAFEFVKQNLEAVNTTLGKESYLSYYIVNIAKGMNTKTQLDKLTKFIESLPSESKEFADKLRIDANAEVAKNLKWSDKYKGQIEKFLETQKPVKPTGEPPVKPTGEPPVKPTGEPPVKPTEEPPVKPTGEPPVKPTGEPPVKPTGEPPVEPTGEPPVTPTGEPPVKPTGEPPVEPTGEPPVNPTGEPPVKPTEEPPVKPTGEPPVKPTGEPPVEPTGEPPVKPTGEPPVNPTGEPPVKPTEEPPVKPTGEPPVEPTGEPPVEPTGEPPVKPTGEPPVNPTGEPPVKPTEEPPVKPTGEPPVEPTGEPPVKPTGEPPVNPTGEPPVKPTEEPPVKPTGEPPVKPTGEPPVKPTGEPPVKPTGEPPVEPTGEPPVNPTGEPPVKPTGEPPVKPTGEPPVKPTGEPPVKPTGEPPVDSSTTEEPSEPKAEESTDGEPDGANTYLPTLSLTIFLALLARYASQIL